MYAPIALFTYNRPDKTQRVLESLMQNAEVKDSDLFIFSDGPKNENAVEGVKANREFIHSLVPNYSTLSNSSNSSNHSNTSSPSNSFKSVTIIEREKNWGLANSLIAGITEVINKYGRVIVVEDDLILSPYFLKFMNDGLDKYEHEDRVGAISGFVYPVKEKISETFFLRYFNCWGWAIWKRSWELLNLDTKYLLRKMRFKKKEFEYGGNGAYGNLYCQKVGLVDSWWVRLYASLFLAKRLTLYPSTSLVINKGNDGTGTHCGFSNDENDIVKLSPKPIFLSEISIKESQYCKNLYIQYFSNPSKTKSKYGIFICMKSFIRRLLFIDCL